MIRKSNLFSLGNDHRSFPKEKRLDFLIVSMNKLLFYLLFYMLLFFVLLLMVSRTLPFVVMLKDLTWQL